MKEEMKSLEHHKVWELVARNNKMKVIKNKWVFNLKEMTDEKSKQD